MSMKTEMIYGYGINASKVEEKFKELNPNFEQAYDKLMMVLDDAPMFKETYMDWIDEHFMELNDEGIDFCLSWECYGQGIGEILRSIIEEKFKIKLDVIFDEDTESYYLMFGALYPWQMTEAERELKQTDIDTILNRYTMMLYNCSGEMDYLKATYNC